MATVDQMLLAPTLIAALGSGLVAGAFFAFFAFVIKALSRLPPGEGIAAMQSINVAVLNPWFLAAFFTFAYPVRRKMILPATTAQQPVAPEPCKRRFTCFHGRVNRGVG